MKHPRPTIDAQREGLDLIPIIEAAARLGIAESSVRALRRRAGFPAFAIAGDVRRLYCFWSDVQEWFRARRFAPPDRMEE